MNSTYNSAPIQRAIVLSILGALSFVNAVLLFASGDVLPHVAQISCVFFGAVVSVLYLLEITRKVNVNPKLALLILFLNSSVVAFFFDLNPAPIYIFTPSLIVSIAVLNQQSSVRGAAVIHLLAAFVCFARGAGGIEIDYLPYFLFVILVCTSAISSIFQISSNRKYFYKVKRYEMLLDKRRATIKFKTDLLREKGEELKQANSELTQRSEENSARVEHLRTVNEELGQIAQAAGRYLKAPLQRIGANVDQIGKRLYKLDQSEGLTDYLHFVTDGSSRMNAMVDDLLHYCDTSVNHTPTIVPTSEVLNIISSNLSNLLLREKAQLIVEDGMPDILGHKTEVLQIFQNLVSNGIKFKKPNVTPICRVGYSISKDVVRFSVSDNGIGIPASRVKDVFGLFTRLHERGSYEGTGIGLALCRRIVLSAGGEIWAESKVGEGTTFNFTWPLHSNHAQKSETKTIIDKPVLAIV